jgi:hypothetical protein
MELELRRGAARRCRPGRVRKSRDASEASTRAEALPWEQTVATVQMRTDIAKVVVLGAGPISIGQACEFDYSGTQVRPSSPNRQSLKSPHSLVGNIGLFLPVSAGMQGAETAWILHRTCQLQPCNGHDRSQRC